PAAQSDGEPPARLVQRTRQPVRPGDAPRLRQAGFQQMFSNIRQGRSGRPIPGTHPARATGRAMKPLASPSQHPKPVASPAEAELLIQHMIDVMDALLGTVEEETELVRAGRLSEALRLETGKAELSELYLVDCARIKGSQDYVARIAPS